MKSIDSQIALVTGASRGIGKEIAKSLAAKGAKLALVARDEDRLQTTVREIQKAGGIAMAFSADVTDAERAREIISNCERELGPIDLLVNNAGISGVAGQIWNCNIEQLWDAFVVNTRGPMLYMHAVLPQMVQRKTGLILNMGSYAAVRPLAFGPGYSASKAALARFNDCVAAAVEEHGVTALTLSPGLVETDMTRDFEYFKDLPPEAWSPVTAICDLVSNLAVRDCSPLNGAFIHVKDDLEQLFANAKRIREKALYSLRVHTLNGIVD